MQFRHRQSDGDLARWSAFELPAVAEARRRRELYEATVAWSLLTPRRPRPRIEAVRCGVRVGRQMALAIWSLLAR
jgi:hypothetical protein